MKKTINTLQDALAHELQGLFYAEKALRKELNACIGDVSCERLKTEMQKYSDEAQSKLLKLQRIFNYLMQEQMTRKNEVIQKLIEEMQQVMGFTTSHHLRDMLRISCIQSINAYKTAAYKNAYMFAAELELDTAADLLQQILEWELETNEALSDLAIREFNRLEVSEPNG